jgi:hypothetical protein
MAYLEKIYSKSKADGHFNKFDSYDAFVAYFKDDNSYKKLWDFLTAKGYKVPTYNAFLRKVKEEPENLPQSQEDTQSQNSGLFSDVPLPAYGDFCIPDENQRKFPDILKLGTIKYGTLELPLMIPSYGTKGFALITSDDKQKELAAKAIELLAFRLLLSLPDGKCKLFIIDPEKNGQSFAHLYGLDPRILERDVWDDASEISNGLQDLKNSIPRIQAELLTTKYKDLNEYNSQVKHSRQPFQFLLIANFPTNFTSDSLQHLSGILKNGAKAGIYCIMSFDLSKNLPSYDGFNWDDFRNVAVEYSFSDNRIANIDGENILNSTFYITSIDQNVPANIDQLKDQLNRALDKSLEVKLESVSDEELWTKSASKGITVPIGMTEDNQIINFQLGDGKDVHHALTGGATGKGKTVLLHNIILNAAKLYSPDEVQFILMDYKEGTEFKIYEHLPHLKVLTISGEIEFGISVFEYLLDQISERGTLFKKSGVSDIAEYKNSTGLVLPRIIVIMDEFQVLLDPKNRSSSIAGSMLEDVSRRGRSFGINLILSTQSLGDVDLSISALGQIGVRIALALPEYDCMKLLHIDNMLPSTFTKAGQAVYNTSQGKKEGNVIFNVAFVEKKKIAHEIQTLITKTKGEIQSEKIEPFIFDGQQEVTIENNLFLNQRIIRKELIPNENFIDIFIGTPFYLSREHVNYRIRKQQESNLLIIGDDPEAAISITRNSLIQISLQSHQETQYYIFDMFSIDSGLKGKFTDLNQKGLISLSIIDKTRMINDSLSKITEELEKRFDDESIKGRVILCFMNFHTIRDFKKGNSYDLNELGTKLLRIIKEGPEYGIHTIIHTLNQKSLDEVFDRAPLGEFENKILLKGQNPADYINPIDDNSIEKFLAYIIHPKSRYEADKFKVYQL